MHLHPLYRKASPHSGTKLHTHVIALQRIRALLKPNKHRPTSHHCPYVIPVQLLPNHTITPPVNRHPGKSGYRITLPGLGTLLLSHHGLPVPIIRVIHKSLKSPTVDATDVKSHAVNLRKCLPSGNFYLMPDLTNIHTSCSFPKVSFSPLLAPYWPPVTFSLASGCPVLLPQGMRILNLHP